MAAESIAYFSNFLFLDLCTELARVLSDQTSTLEEHMNAVRNALNEIRVLIPKKLVEEVTDAAKNRGIVSTIVWQKSKRSFF